MATATLTGHRRVGRTGSAITVRAAPPLDPPFEGTVQPPAGMQLLPMRWPGEGRAERSAERRPAARPALPGQLRPAITARIAAQRYVALCIEVLNGYRPVTHLRALTDGRRFNDVADQLVRRAVRIRISPGQAASNGRLVRVRRLVLGEPADGVAEVAVVLEQGDLCWALALRLERGHQNGWRCVVVQVI